MEAELTSEQLQATKQFLEDVGRRNTDHNNEPIAWNTAIKFLMARKFDIRRSVDLYFQHESVRRKEGISFVEARDEQVKIELLAEKFTVLPGRDSNGAAIALFTANYHAPAHSTHQATLKALVFQLDAALNSIETQRNGLVFVYDMTHCKYGNFDYDLSIKILSMLKGSYPARLKKVLIVTAPLWFKAPFKILRLFVREKLRDRVYTVNLSQLPLHIPISTLPRRLGGRMDLCHKDWVRKCLQMQWGKSSDSDNEIIAYVNSVQNHVPPELSVSSFGSGSGVTTPTGEESSVFSSDLESDSSRGTIHEKSNHEHHEKEDTDMDTTEDPMVSSGYMHTAELLHTWGRPNPGTTGQKRGSDTSPSQLLPGEVPPPPLPRKKTKTTITPQEEGVSIHVPESGGLTPKDLVEYCRIKGRKGLYKEYIHIKSEPPAGSFETSKSKPNLPKNRYTDVLCLEHSRVKLSCRDCESHSDYINANYVDGYQHKAAYISTQGPLPRTFGDFWRMIWEQSVLLVVMTTRTVERSRLKCGQYWPAEEGAEDEYGDFIVLNQSLSKQQDYMLASLLLQNSLTGETREISHFQFRSWPDYGVPSSADAFLSFMFHVREKQAERVEALGDTWTGHPLGPPIAIHCSAGIGRTGTFITMDISTRRLADVGTVEVQKTVRRIRTQRALSIQMPDQYVFCHLALIEHAQKQGLIPEPDLDGFEDSSSDSDD